MRPWFPAGFDATVWTGSPRDHAHPRHLDRLLATIADAQHGTVARAQLRALGITPHQIQQRVRSGHLHRQFRGVYAVGRPSLGPRGQRMAAFLAAGDGARLAGWSGAIQRGLLPQAGGRVDLAVPAHRRVRLAGLNITRVRDVATEVTLTGGIPTHTVARLLLDLAAQKDPGLLEWAWRQAVYAGALDIGAVHTVLADHDAEAGTPALRALCDRRAALAGTLRNRFELLMLSVIREAGLPEPLCNVPYEVAPRVVLRPDFRIPSLSLVIECDGRDGHADAQFVLSDEERDRHYRALGNTVLRVGWWEATRERSRIVAHLREYAGLASRPVRGGS